jgi:hypothetical protein
VVVVDDPDGDGVVDVDTTFGATAADMGTSSEADAMECAASLVRAHQRGTNTSVEFDCLRALLPCPRQDALNVKGSVHVAVAVKVVDDDYVNAK